MNGARECIATIKNENELKNRRGFRPGVFRSNPPFFVS